ncbi:MAG: hypothetical protein KAU20_05400 [Nanoarchaeota archaeon]|nr:hypothetical protein [Nanoarchaeota archaeon]
MVEFNEDGGLKLPNSLIKQKQEKAERMKKGRCILIKKEIINFQAPKKCVLNIKLSEGVKDNRFIQTTYKYFCENSQTPTKITRLNEKEFQIEIGTNFRRCSECNNLISRFREFLDDNVIEEKGNCTYESYARNQNFTYEDHFD